MRQESTRAAKGRKGKKRAKQETGIRVQFSVSECPPAKRGRMEDVSGVADKDITAQIATCSRSEGARGARGARGDPTAIDEFKDKCLFYSFSSVTIQQKVSVDISRFVKGSLRKNIGFWQKIGANQFIIDTIREGYKITIFADPQPRYFKNNESAPAESAPVCKKIQELLRVGLIQETSQPYTVINPLVC